MFRVIFIVVRRVSKEGVILELKVGVVKFRVNRKLYLVRFRDCKVR